MELLTPLIGNRTNPAVSAEIRARSRQVARLWVEVFDTECEHCDRVFQVDQPNELVCKKCRRKEGDRS